MDLLDHWRGRLPWGRLVRLLGQLPPESRWATALRAEASESDESPPDPARVPWGLREELLAQLIDATREVAWVVAQTNSTKRIPHPEPLQRPTSATRHKKWKPLTDEQRARLTPRDRRTPHGR